MTTPITVRISAPPDWWLLAIPREHADRVPATMPWHTLAELDGQTITLNPPPAEHSITADRMVIEKRKETENGVTLAKS